MQLLTRSFCCTYAGDSFCSDYVGDNFYCNCSCIIAAKTVTYIVAVTVTESTTCTIAMESQDLHNCYGKCQLHSSNRNCHLQNWLQKLSLAEMVPVRDSFGYNEEIEGISTEIKAK